MPARSLEVLLLQTSVASVASVTARMTLCQHHDMSLLRPQSCTPLPDKPLRTEYEARSGELALDLAAEGKALAAAKDGLTVTTRGEGARAQPGRSGL